MAVPDDIILGEGVFSIGATDIALTRGGGKFSVKRNYKVTEADGDYGPVKGRIRKVGSVATLSFKALEILPANMPKFYPAMTLVTSGVTADVLTSSTDVVTGDYATTVKFTGKTKTGEAIIIELQNAICLDNIDWELKDKDEVVPEVTYTATYLEAARTTEPWQISFGKGTTYTVTFTVSDSGGVKSGASVYFNGTTVVTNGSGVAAFTGVPVGTNQPFTITLGGYTTYYGSVTIVNQAVAQAVTIVAIA